MVLRVISRQCDLGLSFLKQFSQDKIRRQISSTLQVGENARVYRGFRGAQGPNSEVSSSSSAVVHVHKAVYFVSDFVEFSLFGEHVPCL